MKIIQDLCGRKYRHGIEKKILPELRGDYLEHRYFIDDENGHPVKIGVNELLQDFVADQISDIGGEIIAGKVFTKKDISDRVMSSLSAFSSNIKDPVLEAKRLLLGNFLSVQYGEDIDDALDDLDAFIAFESEIYEKVTNLLKGKNGS